MTIGWILVLAGCGGNADSGVDDSAFNVTPGGGDETLTGLARADLRIDVTPFTDGLETQTWMGHAGDTWSNLSIALGAAVAIDGTVHGYVPTPMSITVPGSESPIEAAVYAFVPDTRNGDATASSLATGAFHLSVTSAKGYTIGVVPTNPQLPFEVLADQSITHDISGLDFDLGESGAVYGVISDRDLVPVRGARVQLVETETRIGGPVVETGLDGSYVLHTIPGVVYDLDVSAADSAPRPIPHVVSAKVWAEPDEPANIDVDLGDLTVANPSGRVVDADGNDVSDVLVRFTAISLAAVDGTLTIETKSDQNGKFGPTILPGHWKVELIPPFDSGRNPELSPASIELDVPPGSSSLDVVELVPRVSVHTVVVDPSTGIPVSGASVTIQELGYDGYVFSAITDGDGAVELNASAVPVRVTVTPPSEIGRAITHFSYGGPNEIPRELDVAYGSLFAGRVTAPDPLTDKGSDAGGGVLLELRVAGEDQPFAEAQTADDGSFSFRIDVEPAD